MVGSQLRRYELSYCGGMWGKDSLQNIQQGSELSLTASAAEPQPYRSRVNPENARWSTQRLFESQDYTTSL